MKAVYGLVEENSYVTQQTLESSEQTRVIVSRNETVLQELHHMSRDSARANIEFLRILDQMKLKDEKSKEQNMTSGASNSENFNRLRLTFLENDAEGRRREKLKTIKSSYLEGAFDWYQAEPAFQSILNKNESLLWIRGAAGMGKINFVAAEKDASYCQETDGALRRRGKFVFRETEATWIDLIESRYTAKSDRRVIIILDGIDAIENEQASSDFATLIDLLGRVNRNEYAVQVIFTCDREKENHLSGLGAKAIHLSRERIISDMSLFASSKIKCLTRLRKLRKPIRRNIVQRVVQKADSFLYIEHTMRRLNALGRETLILKGLESLADNTEAIYRKLLEDCQKN
ncbi:hypothetical protein G6514_003031 [Epicoccum nigrum]|nr:hypothetical protein G6514_003031 [Epicoccum nigrum]